MNFDLWICLVTVLTLRWATTDAERTVEVLAVAGTKVLLPCEMSLENNPILILWYKKGHGTPIYTLDARGRDHLVHWQDETYTQKNIFFKTQSPSGLLFDQVRASDEGEYRCRIDFKSLPTRNTKINFTVIVPPDRPVIVDHKGQTVESVLGPYNEGTTVRITCLAHKGHPKPRLTWWRENALLDSTYSVTSSGTVKNELTIQRLKRSDLDSVFTCQAANNNVTVPASRSVKLDVNFEPEEVKILGISRPLSAGKSYELQCQSLGSRPPAIFTWWLNGVEIPSEEYSVTEDGSIAKTVVKITPSSEDTSKSITCRAENPFFPGLVLQDSWILDIQYVPVASLKVTPPPEAITVSQQVLFECIVSSNPRVYRIQWRHNGQFLSHNTSAGILMFNRTLVLRDITREQSGIYTCVASNIEGDGESNLVSLKVKSMPVCKPLQKTVYNVARGEEVSVACEVDGYPEVSKFQWEYKGRNFPAGQFSSEPFRSVLKYRPMTELDYGTVTCVAENSVGQQVVPCSYRLNPAGRPDSLSNCTVGNVSETSLRLNCDKGFNGGLPQFFIMEVFNSSNSAIVTNVTSTIPTFFLNDMDPGSKLEVSLYAVNSMGRSPPLVLHLQTLKPKERASTQKTVIPLTSLSVLISVAAGVLCIIAVCTVILFKLKRKPKKSKRRDTPEVDEPDVLPDYRETFCQELQEKIQEKQMYFQEDLKNVYVITTMKSHSIGMKPKALSSSEDEETFRTIDPPPEFSEDSVVTPLLNTRGQIISHLKHGSDVI